MTRTAPVRPTASEQSAPAVESRVITVVSATDDGYAMPLAVMIRSALDHLAADRTLRLFVLDGGISEQSRQRMIESWNDPRLTVEFLKPDLAQISDLMISHHINLVTYLRILMPRVLPPSVSKVIYLDADMLVRRDLGELWEEPLGDHAALAVQDIATPCLDAKQFLPRFEACKHFLAAARPIANYRELGLDGSGLYFNGGLFVANLDLWRREQLMEKMLRVLRDHREHVLWWDQYALNVVLAGRWRPLDLRWNQNAHVYRYPSWRYSPLERPEHEQLKRDPWIVHFCSPSKPWNYFCEHPFTGEFRRTLRRTLWKGWRPAAPDNFVRAWWSHHYKPFRMWYKPFVRGLKETLGLRRRSA